MTSNSKSGSRSECHRSASVSNSSRNLETVNGECTHGGSAADLSKIAHKLHQLEIGQKKIIHLLNNLDKELSARICCPKHHTSSSTGSFKTEAVVAW